MDTRIDQLLQSVLAQWDDEFKKGFSSLSTQLQDLQSTYERHFDALNSRIDSLQDRLAALEEEVFGESEDPDEE